MAAAADKFNDSINKVTASISGPFNEAITALLPTITKLAEGIAAAATGFSKLPQPIKEIVVAVGGLALAFNLLAPVIKGVVGLFGLIGGLKIGATIAGFAPALLPVIAGLKTLGEIIVGIFTGPVGWVALLVAAGVAIYLFRDKVGAALNAVVELYKQFFTMLYENFVKPYMDAHFALTRFIVDSFITPTQEALSSFATAIYEYINTNFIEPTKTLFSTVTTYISENFITPVQTAILNFATAAYEYINATFIEPTKALFPTVTTYVAENFIKPTQDAILKFATAAYGYINTNFIEPAKKVFTEVTTFISEKFVKPVQDTINGMIKNISVAFQSIKDAITKPFEIAMQTMKGIVNSILNGIGNAISSVVNAINNVIQGANRALATLKLPQIAYLPQPQLPRFAKGGVVNGPTLAMVGEGNEREYIIPESKMANASANYMAGARGGAVIPAFANGGVVGPSRTAQGRNSTATIKPQINIQTGPVMQMNGTNYVTMQDLGRAVQTGVRQTLNIIQGDMNMRSQMGLS
jgi:phage-related protein